MSKAKEVIPKCPDCGNKTLRHLHNTAHGMPETHMAGSERYECPCGKILYKFEGQKFGFKFIAD